MKLSEILLNKSKEDKSLSAKTGKRADMLKKRIMGYVDKLADPKTTSKSKDSLKIKMTTDVNSLRDLYESEEGKEPDKFEVYDTSTGHKVSGPYSTLKRAMHAADKKDIDGRKYRAVAGRVPRNPYDEICRR